MYYEGGTQFWFDIGVCAARVLKRPSTHYGYALGRIDGGPSARFERYSEAVETERKILHHVFKAGDAWMRTGDLLGRGADGFYTYVDRIGDACRWKGENVSSRAVKSVLCGCPGVLNAIGYGVLGPGADGRACMALLAIDTASTSTASPRG